MENKREICMVVNGKMSPMPQKTSQESIESACVERVGGVYFTTADELEKYIEKSREEKYLRKQKMRAYRDNCGLLIDEAATLARDIQNIPCQNRKQRKRPDSRISPENRKVL